MRVPFSRLQNSIWRLFLSSGAIAALIWSGSYTIARSQSAPASPAASPAASPTVAPATTPPRFVTLRLGAEGYLVAEVQAILKLLGYYTGAIDGRFQDSTATAVAAFQRAAGLTPDGIVGINTWGRLIPNSTTAASPTPASPTPASPTPASPIASPTPSPAASPTPTAPPSAASPTPAPTASSSTSVDFPVLRLGMRGTAVTRLQERLRATGFYSGAIDGVFGPQTQAAVQSAQRRFGLTPDGVVGSATWGALLR